MVLMNGGMFSRIEGLFINVGWYRFVRDLVCMVFFSNF